jgi:hypothetical protein
LEYRFAQADEVKAKYEEMKREASAKAEEAKGFGGALNQQAKWLHNKVFQRTEKASLSDDP